MSRRVLVADDEPNIVAALEFLLRRSGYEVETARNGDEALAMIERSPPDLVLLDVMMPLKDGHAVCQRIRDSEKSRHVKVIMLTAKGRDADVNKGLAHGADLYVTKPFSTRELMESINGLLAG